MTQPRPNPDPQQYAALDLGSNSFHLVLARANDAGRLNLVDRRKEYVRLAAGLDAKKEISETAQKRALETLERFGERIEEVPAENFRAVGTNSFRKARNAKRFLKKAEAALGRPIDVISGLEEARLIYRGVALDCDLEGRRLVVDIGGGSTEVVLGTDETPEAMDSLYMGCVSYTQRFFPEGVLSLERFREAETAAGIELGSVVRKYRRRFDHCVASSGTAGAVLRVIRAAGIGEGITPQSMESLRDQLVAFGRCERIALPEISKDRAIVLPGGLAILISICKQLRISHVERSDFALREGVLVELQGRAFETDVSEGSVLRLMQRFDVDSAQAERVVETALMFFDQVAEGQGWDVVERRRLRWAALLHEVGLFMGYSGHHKHGAYLVANGELPGFSQQGKKVVAGLVLSHRGRLSEDRVRETLRFSPPLSLMVLFRLAVRLHRRRSAKGLPPMKLSIDGTNFRLSLPRDWLSERPLSRADLMEEIRACRRNGVQLEVVH